MNRDYAKTAREYGKAARDYGRNARGSVVHTLATLGRIAEHAPAAQQMLEWAGVQTRRSRRRKLVARMGWLGVGLAVGSGAALLLTPRTGPQLQGVLRKRIQRTRDYVMNHESSGTGALHEKPPAQAL